MDNVMIGTAKIGSRRRSVAAGSEHIQVVEVCQMTGADGNYVATPVFGEAGDPATPVTTIQGIAGGTPVEVTGTIAVDTTGLALDATLTSGNQIATLRAAAKGATPAANVTSTAQGADHQSLDVQVMHAGVAVNPAQIRALSQATDAITAFQGAGPWTTNQAQVAGNAVATNAGNASVGTQRVVIATDQGFTNPLPIHDAGGSITVDGNLGVTGLIPGVAATSLGKAEDAAAADGDTGVMALGVRKDVAATTVSTDGDYCPFIFDGNGKLWVNAGTVTVSNAFALDATLTGGNQKSIQRGGAKGATAAADVTSTAQGADHQALDVQNYHGGAAIDPRSIRALASGTDTVTVVPGAGTFTVGGTLTANIGTTGGLALDATQTNGTQVTKLGTSAGKTVVMKTGALTTTAVTADQVILTYTVTAGKTFYLQYFQVEARLTTFAATATLFGTFSLESPGGTKLFTLDIAHAGVITPQGVTFTEPVPIPAGTVIRLVCTPSAVTSFAWKAALGGYEA